MYAYIKQNGMYQTEDIVIQDSKISNLPKDWYFVKEDDFDNLLIYLYKVYFKHYSSSTIPRIQYVSAEKNTVLYKDDIVRLIPEIFF